MTTEPDEGTLAHTRVSRLRDTVRPDEGNSGRSPFPFPLPSQEQLRDRAQRLAQVSPWRDRPASLAESWEHTRAGGWIPGDWPWWVELPGYVYGVVNLAVRAPLYGLLWLIDRPIGRLFPFLITAFLLWGAWTWGS